MVIRGSFSSWISVLSRVPQGSVLGPILSLIYINDLDYGIKNWILKFADDTKILSRVNNPEDCVCLQRDLDNLVRWSKEWQMLFNVGKCKVMHLGRANMNTDYYMNSKKLENTSMGVIITSDLKSSQQCSQSYVKANIEYWA